MTNYRDVFWAAVGISFLAMPIVVYVLSFLVRKSVVSLWQLLHFVVIAIVTYYCVTMSIPWPARWLVSIIGILAGVLAGLLTQLPILLFWAFIMRVFLETSLGVRAQARSLVLVIVDGIVLVIVISILIGSHVPNQGAHNPTANVTITPTSDRR